MHVFWLEQHYFGYVCCLCAVALEIKVQKQMLHTKDDVKQNETLFFACQAEFSEKLHPFYSKAAFLVT